MLALALIAAVLVIGSGTGGDTTTGTTTNAVPLLLLSPRLRRAIRS